MERSVKLAVTDIFISLYFSLLVIGAFDGLEDGEEFYLETEQWRLDIGL